MRRSICYCEPSVALAGEVRTWKFIYTTAQKLPKGARLKFDLLSKGRSIDWEEPEVDPKAKGSIIYATAEDGKPIYAKKVPASSPSLPPSYEFILPQQVSAEQSIVIYIGSLKPENKKEGSKAQIWSQRRRPFAISVDAQGKGRYDDPEYFTLDVKGNQLKSIKIKGPSVIGKNRRFDLMVRFEDEFGNLTCNVPEDTLIELTHEKLRENLSWKLFIPETGYLALPNLYFNEAGVYTIKLKNTLTGELFYASPIKCFANSEEQYYWGLLHGESERYDSTENIESCLRHFRDECGWAFNATSPFDSIEETPNELWRQIVQNIADFDEADRFTTFIGLQWVGSDGDEGIRQLLFSKEVKAIPRRSEPKYDSIEKIYQHYSAKELLSIPSFTMGKGYHYNFKNFNPQFERVVEIYNAWGSSECTKKEGNLKPITTTGKKGSIEVAEGAIRTALNKNIRVGFVAGGLDDRGIYADFFEGDQFQYTPGATAIIAKEHTRAALFEALQNRSCYATTGPRIVVGFFIVGTPMGREISSAVKPGLLINRHITGYVAGSTKLKKVELICNGKVLEKFTPDDYHFEFAYDDMRPLEKTVLSSPDKKVRFAYYYLRVVQEDDHMAWSSPIWVDLEKPLPAAKTAPKKAEPPKKIIEEELQKEDDDEEEE